MNFSLDVSNTAILYILLMVLIIFGSSIVADLTEEKRAARKARKEDEGKIRSMSNSPLNEVG